jgi:hypothetical protein
MILIASSINRFLPGMRSLKRYILTCVNRSRLPVPILSPCVRNCCLDKQDICIGCGRTVQEITRWGEADDEEKHKILKSAQTRRAKRAR